MWGGKCENKNPRGRRGITRPKGVRDRVIGNQKIAYKLGPFPSTLDWEGAKV